MKAILCLALGLAGTLPAWAQQRFEEAPPLRPPARHPAKVMPTPRAQPWHLSADFLLHGRRLDLGRLRAEEVRKADEASLARFAEAKIHPPRIGLGRSVGPRPWRMTDGDATRVVDVLGRPAWVMAITSPGALGLRLHLAEVDLHDGELTVYTTGEDAVTRGPYTQRGPHGTGEFWTQTVPGDTAYLVVTGDDAPTLEVTEVLHYDRNAVETMATRGPFGPAAQACHQDAMCFNETAVNPIARDAVGFMSFLCSTSPGGQTFCTVCTGTLLNDLDPETTVPYFLTAYHCLNTQADANNLEVVFLWQRDSCGGTLTNFLSLPSLSGATVLAVNPTTTGNDMTLLRLKGEVPDGVSLAGWTTVSPAGDFYGIHHPAGDWKRVTGYRLNNNFTECANTPRSQYHYCEAFTGITEGGSSGSGIFDSAGRLMGQLLGVCPGGNMSRCDNYPNWRAVYGRFDVTYPLIRRWLEMGGTIHVDGAYAGVEEGTPTRPFNTVNEGNNLAWDGTRLKIRTGTYNEPVSFTKQMEILADGGPVTIGRP